METLWLDMSWLLMSGISWIFYYTLIKCPRNEEEQKNNEEYKTNEKNENNEKSINTEKNYNDNKNNRNNNNDGDDDDDDDDRNWSRNSNNRNKFEQIRISFRKIIINSLPYIRFYMNNILTYMADPDNYENNINRLNRIQSHIEWWDELWYILIRRIYRNIENFINFLPYSLPLAFLIYNYHNRRDFMYSNTTLPNNRIFTVYNNLYQRLVTNLGSRVIGANINNIWNVYNAIRWLLNRIRRLRR